MGRHYRWLFIILILILFSGWVAIPGNTGLSLDFNSDNEPDFQLLVQESLGLDLVGGLRVLLQAELPPDQYELDDLKETANNVSRRINALGLSEATVQVQGERRILVELPGVSDPEQAIATIQETALLEFVEFSGLNFQQVQDLVDQHIITDEQLRLNQTADSGDEEAPARVHPVTGLPFETVMTGAGLEAAQVVLDPNTNEWMIEFSLNEDGSAIFGPFTGANIGQPLAIVLDGVVVSAPTIQAQLTTGGVISGSFTQEEARTLALQLRSGALPIPLGIESVAQVGATLGQESVQRSITAGLIGVVVVLMFMLLYYRAAGIAADIALIVFILLNIAVFKLLPITLTLPAITGFLISIGTAVDGNILIFERLKEELRAGKPLDEAVDSGFDRAWSSIRDSNISTIIICVVLFFFGQTPGASIVSGFAITLALGLILNLFTAVIVTRTFLYLIINTLHKQIDQRRGLLGA